MINILTPPSSLPLAPSQLRTLKDCPQSLEQDPAAAFVVDEAQGRDESARIQDWLGNVGRGSIRAASQKGRSWTPPTSQLDGASSTSMLASGTGLVYPGKEQQQQQQQPQAAHTNAAVSLAQNEVSNGQVAYQPSSPVQAARSAVLGSESNSAEPSNQIVSYLQIPASINNSKGSLSEFAAQITCLFWFESSRTLHLVEESKTTPMPTTPLVEEAKPCMGFRKWVTTMLSTTQVTQNVILLALLFIYRLKKQNPQVRGKAGSEYRLLTVALMLGNKFLDDNTYTNKTWADVSGISVAEIHVMEVEFLSNMRYNLYTSEREWTIWHRQLGRFWDYFDRASKAPVYEAKPMPALPTPNGQMALPSPPASQHTSPSFRSNDSAYAQTTSMPPYMAPSVPSSSLQNVPDMDYRSRARKRSYDDSMDEPSAKRLSRHFDMPSQPMFHPPASNGSSAPYNSQAPAKLPMPNFPPYAPASTHAQVSQMFYAAHLPPPPPSQARAMSMVYGNGQTQIIADPHSAPQGQMSHPARVQLPSLYHQPPAPPRLVSPAAHAGSSVTGSPTNLNLTPTGHERLSPSSWPIQRSSPYRPVRSVNTLLVPPPSSSFQNPSLGVGTNSMHYQPLGRPPSERRVGVVPFVHHHDQGHWVANPVRQYHQAS